MCSGLLRFSRYALSGISLSLFVSILSSLCLPVAIAFGQTGSSLKSAKIALNWKPEPQFGGFYAADLNGHFKKHDLQGELIPGGMGTPVVQMVAAGQVDFGIASADEVVISRARGGDVVALFATYQTNPQGIMVHADQSFKNLKDVFSSEKATIAIQKGLPYALYLQNKFGSGKARIVPYQGGITSFLNDKAFVQQCFVTSEPLEARRRGLSPKTFLVADEGYNPYTTVLITRGDVFKKNPALVKAVVQAVRAGWEDYLKNPEAVNRKMSQLNPSMDAQTFKESAAAQKPLIETPETKMNGLGVMSEARWHELVQQLHQMKIIEKIPATESLYIKQLK